MFFYWFSWPSLVVFFRCGTAALWYRALSVDSPLRSQRKMSETVAGDLTFDALGGSCGIPGHHRPSPVDFLLKELANYQLRHQHMRRTLSLRLGNVWTLRQKVAALEKERDGLLARGKGKRGRKKSSGRGKVSTKNVEVGYVIY